MLKNIEDIDSVMLSVTSRGVELDYGYCEDFGVFIGWNNNRYYLLNNNKEIIKELPNIKMMVGEYYDDEY